MIIVAFIYTNIHAGDSEGFCRLSKRDLRDSFSAGLTTGPPGEVISGQIQLEVKTIEVK